MTSVLDASLDTRSLAAVGQTARPRRTVMQVTWSLVAGGSEIYALTVASNLDPRRWRACMCAVDQGGPLEIEVRRRGIACEVMNRQPRIDWAMMWRLFKLFRRHRVDVVHTHHFNQLFYSILPARLLGAKVIHTEHSIECYKKRRLRIAMRLLSLLCDRVTAIGSDGETVLRDRVGIPPRKLDVIRAGVKLDDFDEPQAEARRALDIPPKARVAVIVARLFPEKNHRLLLEAFSDVVVRWPDALLLVAGDGVERDAVAGAVEELGLGRNVRLLGVRRDVPRLLAASDLFVLASDREGLPIAVLEAMAAGKPVVATAVGDLPGVVIDQQTGRLVPPRDRAAMAAALTELFDDPQRAARLGENGRQFVQAQYGVGSMVARHEALYDA